MHGTKNPIRGQSDKKETTGILRSRTNKSTTRAGGIAEDPHVPT